MPQWPLQVPILKSEHLLVIRPNLRSPISCKTTTVVFSRTVCFGSEIFPLAYFINICGESNHTILPDLSELVPFNGCAFLSAVFRNPEAYLAEEGGFHLSKMFSVSSRAFLVQDDTHLCLVLVFSLLDFDVSEHSYEPLHP